MSDFTEFDESVPDADPGEDDPTLEEAGAVDDVVSEDLSGDGVIDTITTMLSTGEVVLVSDTNADTSADTVLLDANGDGVPEVQIVRDGDAFLLSADTNADGQIETDETVSVTADELDEIIPDATALFSVSFADDGQGGQGEPAPVGNEGQGGDPGVQAYTVQPGDTLWDIAEAVYGDGARYMEIAEASGISNPDLIYPGQTLTIPLGGEQQAPPAEFVEPAPADNAADPAQEAGQQSFGGAVEDAAPEPGADEGVIDTVSTLLSNNGEVVVVDDPELPADTVLFDLSGDGVPDVVVVRDGDLYVLAADQDGDGQIDTDRTRAMSAEELDQLIPGATDLLGTTFGGDGEEPDTGGDQPEDGTADTGTGGTQSI